MTDISTIAPPADVTGYTEVLRVWTRTDGEDIHLVIGSTPSEDAMGVMPAILAEIAVDTITSSTGYVEALAASTDPEERMMISGGVVYAAGALLEIALESIGQLDEPEVGEDIPLVDIPDFVHDHPGSAQVISAWVIPNTDGDDSDGVPFAFAPGVNLGGLSPEIWGMFLADVTDAVVQTFVMRTGADPDVVRAQIVKAQSEAQSANARIAGVA